ncbi:MAG: hypothetical protein ABH986_06440 [archaeon]
MAKTIGLTPEDLQLIRNYFKGKMLDEGFLAKVNALAEKRFSGKQAEMKQYFEGMKSIASRFQVIRQVIINPKSGLANNVLLHRLINQINAEGHIRFREELLDMVLPKGPKQVKRSPAKKPLNISPARHRKPRRPL